MSEKRESSSSKEGGGERRTRRTPREPRVGDVVGQYMLVDELAAGGMGRVFRAVDREGNAYALKTILKNEGIYRKRFEREVQVGMVLDHEHLVKLVDCDMNHPWPYLVQELLMGVNLRDLYKARRRLPERGVMFIVFQIAQAINAAVRFQIIHRDIKPDNIFMTTTGSCKLLDMGLVKVGGMERVTEPQDLVGTLQFMAPEQLRDAASVDHHADIYSLGATAYLLLTGRLPRRGSNVREVTQAMLSTPKVSPRSTYGKVSKEADAIISRMTMVDPRQRYETPARLVEDLERYFHIKGIDARTLPSSFLLHELIPESVETESSSDDGMGSSASGEYVPNPPARPTPKPSSASSSSDWATGQAVYNAAQTTGRMHEARGDVSEVFNLPMTPVPVDEPESSSAPVQRGGGGSSRRGLADDAPQETPPHAIPVAGQPPPDQIPHAVPLPPPPPPPPPPPMPSPQHPTPRRLRRNDVTPRADSSTSGSQDPVPVPSSEPRTPRVNPYNGEATDDADDSTSRRISRKPGNGNNNG